MVNWKKVGMGVAAATIGAATFGAVHFMFLAPQWGVGDIMGVPLSVVLPFLLGTLGLIGAYGLAPKMGETLKDIIKYGSAAVIGVGVAQYAGWITTPVAPARARARANFTPRPVPLRPVAVAPVMGTKLI